MTAANRKYQQLNRQVRAWKAMDAMRDKTIEEKNIEVSTKKFHCLNCGYIMFYQAKRCPSCSSEKMEEMK